MAKTVRMAFDPHGVLFGNARIARYLNQRYPDIVPELQTILEGSSLES